MTGFAYAGAEVGIGVVLTKVSEQGRVLWRLAEPVLYELALKDGQVLRFELPAGEPTDGASVPCWLTWLVRVVEYPTFAIGGISYPAPRRGATCLLCSDHKA